MFIKIKSSFQCLNKHGCVRCQNMSQTFLHKVTKYKIDDNLVLSHCQAVCKVGKDIKPAKGRFSSAAMIRPAWPDDGVNTLQNHVHSIVHVVLFLEYCIRHCMAWWYGWCFSSCGEITLMGDGER
jgi:hypothetical protein